MMKSKVSTLSVIIMVVVLGIIIVVNVFRFIDLETIPYGFHLDESSLALTAACIADEGVDSKGRSYPLFVDLHWATPKPPTAVYLAAGWYKMFGLSIASFRALSAFAISISILGLFFIAQLMFGWRYALFVALVGTISPWTWTFSRIAFESTLVVPFLVWGLYFFLRSEKFSCMAIAGILLSGAMYTYPPARLHVPLVIALLMCFKAWQGRFHWKSAFFFLFIFSVVTIPLAQEFLKGALSARMNNIMIWGKGYWDSVGKDMPNLGGMIGVFFRNLTEYFNWNFLFLRGQPMCNYSIGIGGVFNWLDAFSCFVALFFCIGDFIKKKGCFSRSQGVWLLLLFLGFLTGFIPAALTMTEKPNALRAIGAWPFACLFMGYFLWRLENFCQWASLAIVTIAIVFSLYYGIYYFGSYGEQCKGMFTFWAKDAAKNIKTKEDMFSYVERFGGMDYQTRYYIIRYAGETCSSSQEQLEFVKKMREMLKVDSKRMPIE